MNLSKGFTLIELLVSIAIFVFMTALLIAKYGTFNQSVLLTDLAYDVAITIDAARTYGVSVVSVAGAPSPFQYAYGVDMVTTATGNGNDNKHLVLFADTSQPADGVYGGTGQDIPVSTYNIKNGAIIQNVCVGLGPGLCATNGVELDVSFKRPDPSANICFITTVGSQPHCSLPYAEITLKGTDGSTQKVAVRQNGQITVGDIGVNQEAGLNNQSNSPSNSPSGSPSNNPGQ